MMALILLSITSPLLAGDGEALYEKTCTSCHDIEVFTRDDRGVKSLEGLKKRVKQCSLAAESKWADEDVSAVVDYLNRSFYKF